MRSYFTLTIPQRPREIRIPVLGQHIDKSELQDLVRQSGGHFFSAETMRAFRSRLYPEIRPVSNGWAFMTSERQTGYLSGRDYARVYRVRILEVLPANLRIADPMPFTDYASLAAARRALAAYVAAHPPAVTAS